MVDNTMQTFDLAEELKVVKVKFWNTKDQTKGRGTHLREFEVQHMVDSDPAGPLRGSLDGDEEDFLRSWQFAPFGSLDDVFNQCELGERVNFRFEALDTLDVPAGCTRPSPHRPWISAAASTVFHETQCEAAFWGGPYRDEDGVLQQFPRPSYEQDEGELAYLHVVFVEDIVALQGLDLKGGAKSRTVVIEESAFRLGNREEFMSTLAHEVGHILGLYPGDLPDADAGHVHAGSDMCPRGDLMDRHLMCDNGAGLRLDQATCEVAYDGVLDGLGAKVGPQNKARTRPANFNGR
jgi:hypothetical protein